MPQITNKDIWKELKSLCSLIRGDPDDHEDLGLVGDVHDNTKFRRDATKFKWIFIVTMLALCGTIIAQTIIANGGN